MHWPDRNCMLTKSYGENCPGTSAEQNTKKEMELAWIHIKNDDSITKQALQSGHHKATEKEGDQGILGKEIWRKKCGQQDTSTAGGR